MMSFGFILYKKECLFSFGRWFLSWGFCNNRCALASIVDLAKLVHGELWSLDNLDFSNKDRLDSHDWSASFDNLGFDGLINEGLAEFADVAAFDLLLHAADHLLAKLAALGLLGVAGLLGWVELLGEADGEHAKDETIGCLGINLGFDKSTILAHN